MTKQLQMNITAGYNNYVASIMIPEKGDLFLALEEAKYIESFLKNSGFEKYPNYDYGQTDLEIQQKLAKYFASSKFTFGPNQLNAIELPELQKINDLKDPNESFGVISFTQESMDADSATDHYGFSYDVANGNVDPLVGMHVEYILNTQNSDSIKSLKKAFDKGIDAVLDIPEVLSIFEKKIGISNKEDIIAQYKDNIVTEKSIVVRDKDALGFPYPVPISDFENYLSEFSIKDSDSICLYLSKVEGLKDIFVEAIMKKKKN